MDQDCRVSFDHIHSQEAFVEYCRGLEQADTIAFDTEFVSEDRYRPDLCLLQVAANGRFAVIDTQVVKNLQPFWEIITSGEHQTIVHAGREELQFCLHAIGRRPHELFDVPIAAALVGL
ncbi:MAG: ribonuclease D, partial [Planctomycetes bacterium]|nr:ribonuclease D [Planctomycetota bacterium]